MICAQPITHTIKAGDSLWLIAQAYNTTVDEIVTMNPGIDPYNLQIGTQIYVCDHGVWPDQGGMSYPEDGMERPMTDQMNCIQTVAHTIQAGDSLWLIAQAHGTTAQAIMTMNPGIDPYNLQVGTQIYVCDNLMSPSAGAGMNHLGGETEYPMPDEAVNGGFDQMMNGVVMPGDWSASGQMMTGGMAPEGQNASGQTMTGGMAPEGQSGSGQTMTGGMAPEGQSGSGQTMTGGMAPEGQSGSGQTATGGMAPEGQSGSGQMMTGGTMAADWGQAAAGGAMMEGWGQEGLMPESGEFEQPMNGGFGQGMMEGTMGEGQTSAAEDLPPTSIAPLPAREEFPEANGGVWTQPIPERYIPENMLPELEWSAGMMGDTGATATQALSNRMRQVWSQHLYWMRMLMVSILGHLDDQRQVTSRALQSPSDIMAVFAVFYPASDTRQVGRLLTTHVQDGASLVTVLREGNKKRAEELNRHLYENSGRIANALCDLNPYYNRKQLKEMLSKNIDLGNRQTVNRLAGNYTQDVKEFDKAKKEMMDMSDYLTEGIFQQFYS